MYTYQCTKAGKICIHAISIHILESCISKSHTQGIPKILLADEDKDSEEGDDDEKMYGTDYLMTQIFDDEKISEGDDDDTTVTRTARTKRNKSQKRQQESDDSSRTSARNTQRSKRKTHKRIKPRESDSDQDDDNTSNSSTKTKDTQKKNKTVTIAPRANQSRFMDQSFESLGDVFSEYLFYISYSIPVYANTCRLMQLNL